jgi:iron complex transport system substrate-binding protein
MNERIFEVPLTRRQVLAAALATGASVVAGCGSKGTGAAEWVFVDDRKHTARLSERPTRIAAYTTSAAALRDWGVTPVGVFGTDPPNDPWLADFPWTDSDIVGSVYGEIDTAKLRELRTELIVSRWFPLPQAAPLFGFKDLAQQKRIGAEMPIVGLNGQTIATAQIARFSDLAQALGVQVSGGRVARAREAFDRAAERLSKVAQPKSDLRIIAISGEQSTVYVSKVSDAGDLAFYRHRGVPVVSARSPTPYWDRLDWNHVDKYPADGILYDARPYALPLAAAKRIRDFAALPAVRANQIGAWKADPPPSYQAYARTMNDLAATIASWRPVT